jgi:hypothetical protein
MPGDNDMPQLSGSFCPTQNKRLRLLRAIANNQPIAVDADCRANAAYRNHAVPDHGVIRVIGVHRKDPI